MAETKSVKYEPLYISLFRMIYQHPIISAAFLCFFCITLTTVSSEGTLTYSSLVVPSLGVILLGIFAGLYTMHEKPRDTKNKLLSFGIMLFGVIAAAVFCLLTYFKGGYAFHLLNVGMGVISAVFIYLGVTNKLTVRNFILLIMAAGFLVRLCYIISIPITFMQHDVRTIRYGRENRISVLSPPSASYISSHLGELSDIHESGI